MISQSASYSGAETIDGRYVLGEVLGRGGMGEVRAGKDLKLERPVAIKLLHPEMAVKPDLKERFQAEARAAGRLMHPNIVAVYDTGEYRDISFIVMELLPGRNLADALSEQGPFDPETARRVALEILSALDASHREGILHRDIKPGNVLCTPEGSVKVADFGVAKVAEGLDVTMTGLLLGTPAYLSPERIEGEPATSMSDLYAVGVMMYEFLTGKRPFDAETPLGLAMAVKRFEYVPLSEARSDLDPRLVAVVNKAMAKNPADRYATAEEMMNALTHTMASVQAVDTFLPEGADGELPATDATMQLPTRRGAASSTQVLRGTAQFPADGSVRVPARPGRRISGRVWAAMAIAVVLVLSILLFGSGWTRIFQPDRRGWPVPSPIARPGAGSPGGRCSAMRPIVMACLVLLAASGCGQPETDIGREASATLAPQVAAIRSAAVAQNRTLAAQRLTSLREAVANLTRNRKLSQDAAREILDAAADVEDNLQLITSKTAPPLKRQSPASAPTTSMPAVTPATPPPPPPNEQPGPIVEPSPAVTSGNNNSGEGSEQDGTQPDNEKQGNGQPQGESSGKDGDDGVAIIGTDELD
jgi:hypothetical protein